MSFRELRKGLLLTPRPPHRPTSGKKGPFSGVKGKWKAGEEMPKGADAVLIHHCFEEEH